MSRKLKLWFIGMTGSEHVDFLPYRRDIRVIWCCYSITSNLRLTCDRIARARREKEKNRKDSAISFWDMHQVLIDRFSPNEIAFARQHTHIADHIDVGRIDGFVDTTHSFIRGTTKLPQTNGRFHCSQESRRVVALRNPSGIQGTNAMTMIAQFRIPSY
jgi:hypothetical protein